EHEQRVDVSAQTRDLVASELGDLEWPPVRRRPHRLNHVPEVEAARLERAVLLQGQRTKGHREGDHGCPHSPERATNASPVRGSRAPRRPPPPTTRAGGGGGRG